MALLIGVDVGTTSITAVAVDAASNRPVAHATVENDAETTAPSDQARGRSEWDASGMVTLAESAVRQLVEGLGGRRREVASIGVTGQQHGVVLLDKTNTPFGPFINWQDRRGEDRLPGRGETYTAAALARLGPDAQARAGCLLAPGYMGLTLFWLNEQDLLPPGATACFISDFCATSLTGAQPILDPTNAASSGLLNVAGRTWDNDHIKALGLPHGLFPEIREAGHTLGHLSSGAAQRIGLRQGIPVAVALGDNQASFIGSVKDREESVLVNVGTGGQVAMWTESPHSLPHLETRPFPDHGYLLVSAGLCGGRSYALLEGFFRSVASTIFKQAEPHDAYAVMNDLAASVPSGASGLRCRPLFTGTRAQPGLRGSWTGVSPENFTPAHMARALLEGMADVFGESYEAICSETRRSATVLVGAGNGLRQNPLLANMVSERFGLDLLLAENIEAAAVGAATVGASVST